MVGAVRGLIAALFLALAQSALAQPAPVRSAPADIVILGEVHDNLETHLAQARRIEELRPAAVVFEMLSPDAAHRAMRADRTDPAALAAATRWHETRWPPFDLYAPVFLAAREAALFGMAVTPGEARKAVFLGANTVFGAQGARFGLDRPLPREEQAAREALKLQTHCGALPPVLRRGFVEAQRLRDAALAQAALSALAAHGPPVVVITGHGHARKDWGVPRLIARAAPHVTVHSVGYVETEDGAPFDETVLVPATPRADPCARSARPRADAAPGKLSRRPPPP